MKRSGDVHAPDTKLSPRSTRPIPDVLADYADALTVQAEQEAPITGIEALRQTLTAEQARASLRRNVLNLLGALPFVLIGAFTAVALQDIIALLGKLTAFEVAGIVVAVVGAAIVTLAAARTASRQVRELRFLNESLQSRQRDLEKMQKLRDRQSAPGDQP
jgi:uncharacterized membrane protein YeaQ/YmgE (transglycosylase-associated protein family)